MYPDQLVVKPHRQRIGLVDVVVDLVLRVIQKIAQLDRHLLPGNADVLVAAAESARPAPRLVEHLPMQIANEPLIEKIASPLTRRPLVRLGDVDLLPGVQIGLGHDMRRYQASRFIRVERGSARCVFELHAQSVTTVPAWTP